MPKTGPIIVIEDDQDDQLILEQIIREIGITNKIRFFDTTEQVIPYLMDTLDKPFLIICDVNLPGLDGTELRRQINENDHLRKKSIPFIFYTTSARPEVVEEAYKMMVQGYFEKPNTTEEIKTVLKTIMDYWKLCKHPNNAE